MSGRPDKAEEIRREILALDRGIHDLLMRRTEAVLAAQSAETHLPAPPRASQAARVLRGIIARHSGRFPPRALVQIWSDIFFAMDTQTTLHVYTGEEAPRFWDLARTHFGCTMPLICHNSAMAVVHACVNDASALGLVPPPESTDSGQAWWEQLAPAGHPGPRVAQSLPFVRNDAASVPLPQGYVIGAIDQEPTGTDTSVLRLACLAELSRARLQAVLKQAGFDAQILAAGRESPKAPASRLLVANRGFVARDDDRLAAVTAIGGEAIESVALVGGFADPFEAAV
jgi:chorismate mutase/prephenate dehydratase